MDWGTGNGFSLTGFNVCIFSGGGSGKEVHERINGGFVAITGFSLADVFLIGNKIVHCLVDLIGGNGNGDEIGNFESAAD